MKVLKIPDCGFCFGVRHSIEIAMKTIKNSNCPVYTYGPIIHNPQVVEELKNKGIIPIDSCEDVKPGKIIIRSHGTSPSIIKLAKKLGFEVIDATCPFVKKAQNYAKKLCKEGYEVIVVGEKEHPEVIGIVGYTGGKAKVVPPSYDALNLLKNKYNKVGVVAQTTIFINNFVNIITALLPKAKEMRVYNTICKAVIQRQERTIELTKKVDLMLVIGGKNSANTRRLAELSREQGCETYHIETKKDIDNDWFNNKKVIGITAGASTPNWIVDEVVEEITGIPHRKVKNGRKN